jgi:hypothetical protein
MGTTVRSSGSSTAVALRPYQAEAITAVEQALDRGVRRPLVVLPTGCHRAGQGILLYDGTVKRVEDVVVGDLLMGPDSRPRRVRELARGRGPMVEIRPVKGDPWVVNWEHILTLVRTSARNPNPRRNAGRVFASERGGILVDVRIDEWKRRSAHAKHLHNLLRCDVDFASQATPTVTPYLLGALLGEGGLTTDGRVQFTNEDHEALAAVRVAAESHGLRVTRLAHSHNTYSIGGATAEREPCHERAAGARAAARHGRAPLHPEWLQVRLA